MIEDPQEYWRKENEEWDVVDRELDTSITRVENRLTTPDLPTILRLALTD